jgi:chaperonin GroES
MDDNGNPTTVEEILNRQTVDNLTGPANSRIFPEIAPDRVRNICALGDWVCVEPEPAPTHVGVIEIPEQRRREAGRGRNGRGVVVAVGMGRMSKRGVRLPMELKPGDRVLIHEGITRDNIAGYLFVRESDIFGVIEEEN